MDSFSDAPSLRESRKLSLGRRLKCWLQLCSYQTNSDDTGCWGECVTCGKRAGFVSRASLSAYIDRELAAFESNRKDVPQ